MLKKLKDPKNYIGLGVWLWDFTKLDPDPIKMKISSVEAVFFSDKDGNLDYRVTNVQLGKNGQQNRKPCDLFMSKVECSISILAQYDRKIENLHQELARKSVLLRGLSNDAEETKKNYEKAQELKANLEKKLASRH